MSHRVGAWIATGFLVMMLAGMALARPDCDKAPNSRWCRGTTTTTTILSSTTTTDQTTTQPTTTSTTAATTSTTTAPTTTSSTAATTTTTGNSETINLTRDWVITGHDARAGFTVNGNGHQIEIRGGTVDWDSFTIDNVSRVMFHIGAGPSELTNGTVSNSGVLETLGFYPLHWHLNGDTTRGTLVENVIVENSVNHAFVPHASNGITFRNTVARNIIREAYWWDPGFVSHDIVYDSVLAENVSYPRSLAEAQGTIPLHHRMSAFFLGQGTGNKVINSVSRGTSGGVDCSGFHWPEGDHGVWLFEDNRSEETTCHGIFIWQNDNLPHVITRFTGGQVEHGAYVNAFRFEDLDVTGVELRALGRKGESPVYDGGSLGHVVASKHLFASPYPIILQHLTMDSFTVDNGGGSNPGIYILNDTNIGCADVVYDRVVPGTQVIIDGVEC